LLETHFEDTDFVTVISDLIDGQDGLAVHVIAFNPPKAGRGYRATWPGSYANVARSGRRSAVSVERIAVAQSELLPRTAFEKVKGTMNSSKSALLSAIIATVLLLVCLGLIFAFLPNRKHGLNAQGNLPTTADARMER
jgi:hypothetical protein